MDGRQRIARRCGVEKINRCSNRLSKPGVGIRALFFCLLFADSGYAAFFAVLRLNDTHFLRRYHRLGTIGGAD